MTEKFMGQQMMVDLYGCNTQLLDDITKTKSFIHRMCDVLETEIVEEAYHKFEPIGISAFAVITTSHFSVHTWPEFGYAAVDVFSCNGKLSEDICDYMKDMLQAETAVVQTFDRHVAPEPARSPVRCSA